ncbi:hypothetical protein U9M48_019706, partial [Paspalum notatum var. saurae]
RHRVLAKAGIMEKDDAIEIILVDEEDLWVGNRRPSRAGGMNERKVDCVATAAGQKSDPLHRILGVGDELMILQEVVSEKMTILRWGALVLRNEVVLGTGFASGM